MTLKELILKNNKEEEITFENETEPRKISDITEYIIKQAGLCKFDKVNNKVITDFTNDDIKYIAFVLKTKKLNPFIGEISFFKAKSGKVEAMPYYGALIDKLSKKLRKQLNKKESDCLYKYEVKKDDILGIYGHLEVANGDVYDLALSDYPQYKGPLQYIKLRKQTFLQYIKENHHDIHCGFDIDEVKSFHLAKDDNVKVLEEPKSDGVMLENIKVEL